MSKYLKQVIEEMGSYSEMGMPDGEGAMGMGSVAPMGMRGGHQGKAIKAYKLNDVLRHRNQAEEEEGLSDMEGMDDYESDEMDDGVEELKQFFMDNPEPSDEEISMYAEEKGMDLQEMRKAVYSLIQSLLPDDEEGMDDPEADSMDDSDSLDFNVSGDTGERPASNEMDKPSRF